MEAFVYLSIFGITAAFAGRFRLFVRKTSGGRLNLEILQGIMSYAIIPYHWDSCPL